jgi:hypothetical protein
LTVAAVVTAVAMPSRSIVAWAMQTYWTSGGRERRSRSPTRTLDVAVGPSAGQPESGANRREVEKA